MGDYSKGHNSKDSGGPIGCEPCKANSTETPGKNATGGKGANSKDKAAYVGAKGGSNRGGSY